MKYSFTFREINYGVVSIEADSPPSRGDVVNEIMNGKAYYGNTDYTDIELSDIENPIPGNNGKVTSSHNRDIER